MTRSTFFTTYSSQDDENYDGLMRETAAEIVDALSGGQQ
jgi:hypothetical protein